MNRRIGAAFFMACLILNVAPAHAGPCTNEIARFELAVRQSAGKPDAGPFGPQSVEAQIDRQPTPASVKRAKKRAQSIFLRRPWRAPSGSMREAIVPDAHGLSLPPRTCTICSERSA
jgi:hypothetical protein